MLKCKPQSGTTEAWPRLAKPAALVSTAPGSSDATDEYEGQAAPSYQTSLSDAIQAALDNYDQNTVGERSGVLRCIATE